MKNDGRPEKGPFLYNKQPTLAAGCLSVKKNQRTREGRSPLELAIEPSGVCGRLFASDSFVFVAERVNGRLVLLNVRKAGGRLHEVIVGVVVVDLGNLANDQIAAAGLRAENVRDIRRG